MSNNVPVLMLRGVDGKFFPVAGITGGGGGGTGGASTAEDVSYTNTQLPNVKNVKTALDELIPKSHSHGNKGILDKFGETDGNPTYNGQPIGGGGGSEAFVIPMTAEPSDDKDIPITCTVTYDQIDEAYNAGKELVVKVTSPDFGELFLPLIEITEGTYIFSVFVNDITFAAFCDGGWALNQLFKHTHDNKDVLDRLSISNGKLQYAGSDVGLKPSQVTSGVSITLADNTEYRLTDVSTLTLNYPAGDFECWMRLSFAASGTITVTLPSTTQYIGSTPDFKNGETWELSIKDGVVIAGKVA